MQRPDYQAIDAQGLEYIREALIIDELPLEARSKALTEATSAIAEMVGLEAIKKIPFGAPVFTAFSGMNRPKAKHHQQAKLLLAIGGDVSLDFCAAYN